MATPPLITVQTYSDDVRVLIKDTVRPFRYTDDAFLAALNLVMMEVRRLRADLFVTQYGSEVPYFGEVSGAEVPIEAQFRFAVMYGIAANILAADDEDVMDNRVNIFNGRFYDALIGVRPRQMPVKNTPAGTQPGGGPPGGGE